MSGVQIIWLAFLIAYISVLGVGQTPKFQRARILTVNFCDLTEHPERYTGKVVRTRAIYVAWWESNYLFSSSCSDDEHKIYNVPDCPTRGITASSTPEEKRCLESFGRSWAALNPFMRSSGRRYKNTEVFWVSADFIGRLEGPGEYYNVFKYQFRVRRVERPSVVPHQVPW